MLEYSPVTGGGSAMGVPSSPPSSLVGVVATSDAIPSREEWLVLDFSLRGAGAGLFFTRTGVASGGDGLVSLGWSCGEVLDCVFVSTLFEMLGSSKVPVDCELEVLSCSLSCRFDSSPTVS